jgi:two-component system response regulator
MKRIFRAIFVDDSPDDCFLYARALRASQPNCIAHFLKSLEEFKNYMLVRSGFGSGGLFPLPDLVVSDIKMPAGSGLELLSWIKSIDDLRHIPVMLLTSTLVESDIRKAMLLGAELVLEKPFSAQARIELFNEMFGRLERSEARYQLAR